MPRRNAIPKAIDKIANPKRILFPARMGTGENYTYIKTGTPNRIWVTYEGSGIKAQVWNLRLPATPGLRVLVGEDSDEQPGLLQVLRERLAPGGTPTVPLGHHHTTHELFGSDEISIYGGQVVPLNAVPIADTFTVVLYGAVVLTGIVWTNVRKQNVTLVPPVSGAYWGLIQIPSTGVATLKYSTVVTSRTLLTYADIPLPDANCYPAWAVQLYSGQAMIRRDSTFSDLYDLRWANGYLGGGVPFGGLAANRVAIVGSDGILTTDPDLLYDAVNNILTMGAGTLPVSVANSLNIIAESGSLGRFEWVYSDVLDNSGYDTTVRGGGTSTAPTAVTEDMVVKRWRGRGYYNNTGGITATKAEILLVADGNWSGTSNPTRIELWTTPVGSVTLTKALTVGSDGILYDGNGDQIGGHVIMDEGVPLTARANLNFIGAGVTATDNAGVEVIGDPGFDDPDYWDETNGFTIVGGKAVASGNGYSLQATDSSVTVPGVTYNVSVDVVVNGGILTLETSETIGTISTTGTHTFSFSATEVFLWFYCDAGDFDGTIDNFSAKTQAATDVTISGNAIPAGNDKNIQFNDGGVFGGDDGFTWDKDTNTLTFTENDGVEPDIVIKGKDSTAPANGGGTLYIQGGAANTSIQNGGDINIQGGANPLGPGGIIFLDNAASLAGGALIAQAGSSTGVGDSGGFVQFNAGSNAALSGDGTGGYVQFSGGGGGAPDGDGGDIIFYPGNPQGTGTIGKVIFGHNGTGKNAKFDLELLLSSDKTFTLPNKNGTFAMVSDLITQNIILPGGMGTPTYDDLQDFLNMTQASGRLTGGVLTAHAGPNGTLDISAMEGMIHTANTLGSPLIYFKKAAVAEIALTDLVVNYIWITYTEPGGTPTLTYSANAARPTEDYNVFVVGRCWRSGNNVEVLTTGQNIYNQYGRMQDRLLIKYGAMDHASGSTLAAHATPLRLTCDAGIWYFGNSHIDTGAVSTFHVWYKTGGGAWTESAALTLFSEVFDGAAAKVYETYQNGTSLGTLSGSKYGVYWIYECPEGDLYVVLGTSDYANIAAAQAATIPASLPPYCQYWSRLIGRVICQKTGAAFYSVESAFVTQFTVSAGAFVPSDRVITATSPITIDGGESADLSANRTIAIPAATAAVNGYATSVQITKLDGIAAGANLYVHPNHSGDVISVSDGPQTIGVNKVTLAKLANQAAETVLANATAGATVPTALVLAEQTVLGRITGGHVVGLTATQIRTLANVADGSQVNVLEGVTGTAPIVAGAIAAKSQAISISAATTGAAGSMSAADKTKLDGLSAGSWITEKKAADESVQSDTTVNTDSDVFFLTVPSKTYAVRGRVWFSTPAAADFKFRFTFGGTSIFVHHVSIPCGSATETVGLETASPTTTISCLGTGTTGGYIEFDGVVVSDASERTFAFQWAQVTSTASPTTVLAGSYLEYMQID